MKKILKKALNTLGLQIHLVKSNKKQQTNPKNKYLWLTEYRIGTILDIGANIGQFALAISDYFPEAFIYSFEPLKDVYEQLLINGSKIKKFKAFNLAISDTCGVAQINRSEYSPSSSLLKMSDLHKQLYPFTSKNYEEKIFTSTIDDLVLKNQIELTPEILTKIDVQGFENKVIHGGINTLKKAKVVITEVCFWELYNGQPLFDSIHDILINLGYECKGIFDIEKEIDSGRPIYGDAVFIRK